MTNFVNRTKCVCRSKESEVLNQVFRGTAIIVFMKDIVPMITASAPL